MLKEFKEFAIKGNMVDMAVGIVIGAAFGAIVSSLVDDVFMPVIGLIIGGIDFSNWFVPLGEGTFATIEQAKEAGVATLNIGLFINAIIKFLIIAFALFMVVKAINAMKREAEEEPAPEPAEPPAEEKLLSEIRDLLAKQAT
ncbi:MAG: large conductance mechanosensitive channel protein MscL [Pseudomonadota bacterium]